MLVDQWQNGWKINILCLPLLGGYVKEYVYIMPEQGPGTEYTEYSLKTLS